MLTGIKLDLGVVIRAAVEKHFEGRSYYRDEIAEELVASWLEAYPDALEGGLVLTYETRQRDTERLLDIPALWNSVGEIISELEMAFPSNLTDKEKEKRWHHQGVIRLSSKDAEEASLSLESLSRTTWIYLRAKWADSPTLECWLVRQMLYAETAAFSRETGVPLRAGSAAFWWRFTKNTVKWLIGVFVAVGVGQSHGTPLGVLTYVAWVTMIHLLARDGLNLQMKLHRAFLQMQTAYRVATRSTTYPVEVERYVALAEREGAVWPEGLHALLHKAMQRSPLDWARRSAY